MVFQTNSDHKDNKKYNNLLWRSNKACQDQITATSVSQFVAFSRNSSISHTKKMQF